MLKKLAIAALLLWCLGLAGCSASGTGSGRQVKEIREYLEARYGSQDFQVEPSQNGGTASYQVIPVNYPEAAFTVEEGKLEESSDYSYHDDFAAQMLYGGADRLGLSYEKGAEGYDIFVTYENFASLDTLGGKLEQLVTCCRDSRAFDKLRTSCLITVKPESETDPYFPGYEIRLETRYSYPLKDDFGIMASDLEEGKLTDSLKHCHVYTAYNYTIPTDSAMFSASDLEGYKTSCTGATGEAKDGSITIYELANKDDLTMTFGGVYQLLSQEGLVTETSKDSFTASGNGVTIQFTRAFGPEGPSVSCQILTGEDQLDSNTLDMILDLSDARYAAKGLTGKTITFSTPEKIAAAKDAERLERLPLVEEAFANAAAPGQSLSLGTAEVTLLGTEQLETLQGDSLAAMHSTEEEVWCAMDMRIRNTGTEELNVFHLVFYGGGNELFGIVADKDANLYKPVDVINLGLEDIYGQFLPAGETLEGRVYFKLPRDRMADGSLALLFFCGAEEAAFLLD